MEQIPTMTDGVTSLAALLFNQMPDETENAILAAGLVLTNADLNQLSKAIAVYAARGDYYTDVGIANTYALAAVAPMNSPPDDNEGTWARFRVVNANTGAATVQLPGLTSRTITRMDGTALLSGDMSVGDLVAVQRRSTEYRLLNLTKIQNQINALGSLAFLNEVTSAEIQNGTILNEDVASATLNFDRFTAGTQSLLSYGHVGTFNFVDGSKTLSIPNLFLNAGTPGNYIIFFDCQVDGQITGKELQFQLYRNAILDSGASDYAWEYTGRLDSGFSDADSKMGFSYSVNDAGARIVNIRGSLLVSKVKTIEITTVTGQFTAANDSVGQGVDILNFAGSRDSESATDTTGIMIRVASTGSGAFAGGSIDVYSYDNLP